MIKYYILYRDKDGNEHKEELHPTTLECGANLDNAVGGVWEKPRLIDMILRKENIL